jgi:hypothetical protein
MAGQPGLISMTEPIGNKYEFALRLARDWGIFAVMVLVLLYFGYQDHLHNRAQLDSTRLFVQDRLTELVAESVNVNNKIISEMGENREYIDGNQKAIINNQGLIIEILKEIKVQRQQMEKLNRDNKEWHQKHEKAVVRSEPE